LSSAPEAGTVSAYTLAQIVALARTVKDYKAKSYVEAAQVLSSHVLKDADSHLQHEARDAEVLEQRHTLKRFIERIASAGPDERDTLIAEALTAARSMQ